jgi:hypothetical protein
MIFQWVPPRTQKFPLACLYFKIICSTKLERQQSFPTLVNKTLFVSLFTRSFNKTSFTDFLANKTLFACFLKRSFNYICFCFSCNINN